MKTNLLKLLTDAEAFVSTRACTPQGRRLAARLAAAVEAETPLDPVVVSKLGKLEAPAPFEPLLLDDSMPCPDKIPDGWVQLKVGEKIQRHDLVLFSTRAVEWSRGNLIGLSWDHALCPMFRHPSRF